MGILRMILAFLRVLIAFRAPWQNPYVERVIGSIRRECLDHLIVLNEDHLRNVHRADRPQRGRGVVETARLAGTSEMMRKGSP